MGRYATIDRHVLSFLPRAQLLEVFGRLGDDLSVQTDFDASGIIPIDGHVKVDRVGNLRVFFAKQALKDPADFQGRAKPGGRSCTIAATSVVADRKGIRIRDKQQRQENQNDP
jgi:hypothetical protein